MPRPVNPQDLIYAPSDDIPYPNWATDIGDRAVFRVSGLYEFRVLGGRNDAGTDGFANDKRLGRAKDAFAESGWEQHCTEPRNRLTTSGVAKYLKARNGRRTRLSLYSALIIVLMLEDYLAERGDDIDIYAGDNDRGRPAMVRIVPYIFDLPQATPDSQASIIARSAQIKTAAGQRSTAFVPHMCAGNEMFSELTCKAVHDACEMKTGLDVVVGEIPHKSRGRKERLACSLDRVVYPLT